MSRTSVKLNRFTIVATARLAQAKEIVDRLDVRYVTGKFADGFSYLHYHGDRIPSHPDIVSNALKGMNIGHFSAIGDPTNPGTAKRIGQALKGMGHKFAEVTPQMVERFTVVPNNRLATTQHMARQVGIEHTTVPIDDQHSALRYKGPAGPADRNPLVDKLRQLSIPQLSGTGSPLHAESLDRARFHTREPRIAETKPEIALTEQRKTARITHGHMKGTLETIGATTGESRSTLRRLERSMSRALPFAAPIIAAGMTLFQGGDAKAAITAAIPGASEVKPAEATMAKLSTIPALGLFPYAAMQITQTGNDVVKVLGHKGTDAFSPSGNFGTVATIAASAEILKLIGKNFEPKADKKPADDSKWPSPPMSR